MEKATVTLTNKWGIKLHPSMKDETQEDQLLVINLLLNTIIDPFLTVADNEVMQSFIRHKVITDLMALMVEYGLPVNIGTDKDNKPSLDVATAFAIALEGGVSYPKPETDKAPEDLAVTLLEMRQFSGEPLVVARETVSPIIDKLMNAAVESVTSKETTEFISVILDDAEDVGANEPEKATSKEATSKDGDATQSKRTDYSAMVDELVGEAKASATTGATQETSGYSVSTKTVVIGAVVAAAVGFFGYRYFSSQETEDVVVVDLDDAI